MNEWNVCSKNLPLDGVCVWCFGTYEGYDASGFEGYYHERSRRWFCVNNGDYRDGGFGDDYIAEVTHWMQLPAPPAK